MATMKYRTKEGRINYRSTTTWWKQRRGRQLCAIDTICGIRDTRRTVWKKNTKWYKKG